MKVCQTCGATYKDYIDFCFNDGQVLTAMAAAYDGTVTEVPHGSLAVSPHEDAAVAASAAVADPSLVDIDNVPIDEDEPTQQSDPHSGYDDERTVPRLGATTDSHDSASAIGAALADPSAATEPFPIGRSPSDADPYPGADPSFADPERTDPTVPDHAMGEPDEEPTEAARSDEPAHSADEENTPVLQEPVIAAAPPSMVGDAADFESAATVIPDSSLSMPNGGVPPLAQDLAADESKDPIVPIPAPIATPTPLPSPAPVQMSSPVPPPPPPVPNSLGQTLPMREGRTPPQALGRAGAVHPASDAIANAETRPIGRPSATPTMPAVMLRGGEDELPAPQQSSRSRAGILLVAGGAFVVGIGLVGLFLLGTVLVNWMTSSNVDPSESTATLPPPAPTEPLPLPEVGNLDDEDDFGDEPERPGIQPSAVAGTPSDEPKAPPKSVRESKSISVVTSLSSSSDGTGQRPILFESTPPNALVTLEGHEPFRTPSEVRLNIGERYSYTMQFPGYDPIQSNFMVMGGAGVLRRTEHLVRTPTTVPSREGPIVFGPQGCRLRVDGTLMESEDIVGGTKIDDQTGRPMVYLPFQLKGRVLQEGKRLYMFQVVSDDSSAADCDGYDPVSINYRGQASIVLK